MVLLLNEMSECLTWSVKLYVCFTSVSKIKNNFLVPKVANHLSDIVGSHVTSKVTSIENIFKLVPKVSKIVSKNSKFLNFSSFSS